MSKTDGSEYRRKLVELAEKIKDFPASKISRSRKSCRSSSPTPSEMSQYGFSKAQSVNSLSSASSSKKKNKNHLLEPERMKELETVEAQMANIAQSLSQKRRRQSSILSKGSKDVFDLKKLLTSKDLDKERPCNVSATELSNRTANSIKGSEESDRTLMLQYLAKSQLETERRRLALNAIRMALESLEYSERSGSKDNNITLDIQDRLKNEDYNLRCLKEEQSTLLQVLSVESRLEKSLKSKLSIYRFIKDDPDAYQIRNSQFVYNPSKPCVRFAVDESGYGVFVNNAEEGIRLAKGDRILEVNSSYTFCSTLEEVLSVIIPGLNSVTILRKVTKGSDYDTELKNLQVKYAAIQRERDALKQDKIKQSHRITYLEEQVNEMEHVCAELRTAGEIIHTETENLLRQIRGNGDSPETERDTKHKTKKPKPPRTSLLRKGEGSDTSSVKSEVKSDISKPSEKSNDSGYHYNEPHLKSSEFNYSIKSDHSFRPSGIDSVSGRHIHHHEALYATTDLTSGTLKSRCETPTDNRSVASADGHRERHRIPKGYSSDIDRTIPRQKKFLKPPVPKKPSFLLKSSSLQSIERRQDEFINGYDTNPSGFNSMNSVKSEKGSLISVPGFKWPLLSSGKKLLSIH
ncbi:uncharacterized protein LOC136039882 isoform X2 [Artemia franciscana]